MHNSSMNKLKVEMESLLKRTETRWDNDKCAPDVFVVVMEPDNDGRKLKMLGANYLML